MLRGSVITGRPAQRRGPAGAESDRAGHHGATGGGERRAVNLEDALGIGARPTTAACTESSALPPGDYIVSVPRRVRRRRTCGRSMPRNCGGPTRPWAASGHRRSRAAGPAARAGAEAARWRTRRCTFPARPWSAKPRVVTLGPSEERPGVDFALLLVPTAQIKGRVIDTEGRPQGGSPISLKPAEPNALDLFASLLNTPGRTRPGRHVHDSGRQARQRTRCRCAPRRRAADAPPAAPPTGSGRAARRPRIAGIGGGGRGTTHWADGDVNVQGVDVNDITLTLRPGMTVSGKIVYEATTKTPPTDLTKTALSLIGADHRRRASDGARAALLGGGATMAAKVAADGTFTISGVAPGRYRLNTPLAHDPDSRR